MSFCTRSLHRTTSLQDSLPGCNQVAGLLVPKLHGIPQHVHVQQLPDVLLLVIICAQCSVNLLGDPSMSLTRQYAQDVPRCGSATKRVGGWLQGSALPT